MMKPDFHLFSYAKVFFDDFGFQNGIWRFVLKAKDGGIPFEAFDQEDGWHVDRLNLLSVVRGLESLEQPSSVLMYTPSRYITRAFENALQVWKKNSWMWERFGEDVPIKNQDLWLRVDQALMFHDVDCRFYGTESHQRRLATPQRAGRRKIRLSGEMGESGSFQSSNRPSYAMEAVG